MTDEPTEIAPIIVTFPAGIDISYATAIDFMTWKASIYNNLAENLKQYPQFFGPYSTKIESTVTENPTKPWIIPNLIAAFGNKLTALVTALDAVPSTTLVNVGGGFVVEAGELKRTLQNFQKIIIVDNDGMPPAMAVAIWATRFSSRLVR